MPRSNAVRAMRQESTPNAERSEAMRARLLEATIDAIIADGWTNASTAKIAGRAGVSRGAQTHHFPTRNGLLLAAVRENSRQYRDRIDDETPELNEKDTPLRAYLELLWDACFDEKFVQSWVEVLVAARTDDDLSKPVKKLDAAAMKAMRDVVQILDDCEDDPALNGDIIELSVTLLRGMVMQNGIHRNRKHQRYLFEQWLKMADFALITNPQN